MITQLADQPSSYQPIYWILFYISALVLLISGNHILWKFNLIIGIVSFAIIVIYILGGIQYGNFDRYAEASVASYEFNGYHMMQHFHLASWFYIGVQSLPLCCVDCAEPRTQIPWAMTTCMITLFVTAIAVYFVTCAQDPGTAALAISDFPLNYGFSRMFGISNSAATWLSLPATYATGFGFMFCYGRQISAMAKSGLLPSIFQHTTSFSHTPYLALLFGTAISIILVLIIEFALPSFMDNLFLVCMLASYCIYCFAFFAYIIFVDKYSSVSRSFRSPLGIAGAVYGIVIFLVGFIGTIGFQDGNWVPIVIFIVYLLLATGYYFFQAGKNQKFSADEQKALFTAYVINANAQSRNNKRKKKHYGSSPGSSVSSDSGAKGGLKRSKLNSVVPSQESANHHSIGSDVPSHFSEGANGIDGANEGIFGGVMKIEEAENEELTTKPGSSVAHSKHSMIMPMESVFNHVEHEIGVHHEHEHEQKGKGDDIRRVEVTSSTATPPLPVVAVVANMV